MINGSDDWRIERHSELPVVEMRDQESTHATAS